MSVGLAAATARQQHQRTPVTAVTAVTAVTVMVTVVVMDMVTVTVMAAAVAVAVSRIQHPPGSYHRCITRQTSADSAHHRIIRRARATATAQVALCRVPRVIHVTNSSTLMSCNHRILSSLCWPRNPYLTMIISVSRRINGTSQRRQTLPQAQQQQRREVYDTVDSVAVATHRQLCPIWRPRRRLPLLATAVV